MVSRGYLDVPCNGDTVSDNILVYGWFLCESGVHKIEVQLDETVIGIANYGDFRDGFDALFPEYGNKYAGFNYNFDTSLIRNGEHILYIRVFEMNGDTHILNPVNIIVSNTTLTCIEVKQENSCLFYSNTKKADYFKVINDVIYQELISFTEDFGRSLEILFGSGTIKRISDFCSGIDASYYDFKPSVFELPFNNNEFETGLFFYGFDQALYPMQVMNELHRVIKPGGYCHLAVTKENFHSEPTHVSNWSSKSIARFMARYGDCKIKCIENIYMITVKIKARPAENQKPALVYCDLNTRDTYTPYWVKSFQSYCDLRLVSLTNTNIPADENLMNEILEKCNGADILHLGTGAVLSNIAEILDTVKYRYPEILISKWYGDVDIPRYETEVYELSDFFDMVFLASGNFIGSIKSPCGQVHINGVYDTDQCEFRDWNTKDIDVLIIANGYSRERLSNIASFIPVNKAVNTVWIGDGSPKGRVSRQEAFEYYSRAKIVFNIVDSKYAQSSFWVSTRVYLAVACGCIVFTTAMPFVDALFDGGIVQLPNTKSAWQNAANTWLFETDPSIINDMIKRNYSQITTYHTFDYKVKSILAHLGFD